MRHLEPHPCRVRVARQLPQSLSSRLSSLPAGRHKITLVDADARIKDSFFVDVKAGGTQTIGKDYLPKEPPKDVVPTDGPKDPPADPAPKKDGTINPFAHKP